MKYILNFCLFIVKRLEKKVKKDQQRMIAIDPQFDKFYNKFKAWENN